MKIGMILDTGFPPDPRVEREAIALISFGHEVEILCLKFGKERTKEIYKGIKIHRNYLSEKIYKKVRPMVVNFPYYNHFWKSKIKRFITETGVEVLHVHDLPLMQLTIKIAQKYNIKVVGDFHENYTEAMKMYDWANTLRGKIFLNHKKWEKAQRYAFEKLDKIVVCAEEAVKIFENKYARSKKDFYVVENTIDIRQFNQKGIDKILDTKLRERYKDTVVFGYIGGVIPNRGLQHFIYLLPQLKNLNIMMVIVGRGGLISKFKKFIATHGLGHMVDWYGWQPFEKISTFINNFDIGITRLEKNKQNDATTANKVFQYMHMGKPVLTADSLPMKRIVEWSKAGLVHKSGSQSALKDNIIRLCQDKALRKRLGNAGVENIKNIHNWDNTKQNLHHLYNEIEVNG